MSVEVVHARVRGPARALVLAAAVVLLLAGCAIDLGGLGGDGSGAANDVNASGVVVGWSMPAEGQFQAFRKNGEEPMRRLPPLDGYDASSAHAVNDAGVVVGASLDPLDAASRATSWDASGTPVDLGPGFAEARGVNSNGTIVGSDVTAANTRVPVIYRSTAGRAVPLPLPAGVIAGEAVDVNDLGQVIGNGYTAESRNVALSWSPGPGTTMTVTVLEPAPGGGTDVNVRGLNDAGQIVGWGSQSSVTVALHWSTASAVPVPLTPLPCCPSDQSSVANDISDAGVIVGSSLAGFEQGVAIGHAVRWETPASHPVDLGTLGISSSATRIGSTGIIVGASSDEDRTQRPVRFDPD